MESKKMEIELKILRERGREMFFIYINRMINRMRVLKLKLFGANIGTDMRISGKIIIYGHYSNLLIGNYRTINYGVLLVAADKLTIGNNVRISPYAQIHTSGLILDQYQRSHFNRPTIIKDNVWIASGAIINAGVVIGENSVIGAGAVVTKDVEPNSFYAGVPARKIRNIIMPTMPYKT
jgi:acetyltransferase-like isoleucine patch superfamily enzyme